MDGNLSRYSEIGWVIDENVSEINKYVLEEERNKDHEGSHIFLVVLVL